MIFAVGNAPASDGFVELLFVGDAMQHQAQLDRAREIGGGKSYDYSGCFVDIAPEIQAADYAVCNLEVPLGGGPDYSGFPHFSAPDAYAKALKDAGFDLFLTANNHCLDRGDKAARRTLTALENIGVDYAGTFHDGADREAKVPLIKDINGIKFGFLNYTYGTNGIEPKAGAEVALIDKDMMAREIRKTREAGAEIIVVAMHWGLEYMMLPTKNQEDLADFLIDNGVDMIIGSHPHVVQPMKVVHNDREDKDVLVVYSLGNFLSNMRTADTRGGALVRARVIRDENGKAKFKDADYDTFMTAKPSGGKTNFRVIPSWRIDRLPSAQQQEWELFHRGSSNVFDAYNVNVPRRHK